MLDPEEETLDVAAAVAKKRRRDIRPKRISQKLVENAMRRRVDQRTTLLGTLKIPAVPALVDEYVAICSDLSQATGRPLGSGALGHVRTVIANKLEEAFAGSPRSKIAIHLEAPPARPFAVDVTAEIRSLAAAYETWIGSSSGPLFGAHPDARVLSLAEAMTEPESCPILDLGAGTGRNSLALAHRGHPVDAVEITPKFAQIVAAQAAREGLGVRVIEHDVFEDQGDLRRDYRLLIASEVAPDFRGTDELRALFQLAADVLGTTGLLVFNVHMTDQGYTPDRAARQFAQQCYSALFTPTEVQRASDGLPLELVASDEVYAYEKAHLPPQAWPPTPWFKNWVSGRDVYELERGECPARLVWLVYRKTKGEATPAIPIEPVAAHGLAPRARRYDPSLLRQSVIRRLGRRAVASWTLTFPAVPAMLDAYVEMWFLAVTALRRRFEPEDLADARQKLATVLDNAYATSPRSNVVVTCEVPMGEQMRYQVTADAVPITTAYEDWLDALPPPLFGAQPDARVLSLAEQMGPPASCRVLEIGAGLGRNALELARRGYRIDAVEMTPKFAGALTVAAQQQALPIRVIASDVFEASAQIGDGYRLVLLSSVVGDFRSTSDLRRICELADDVLAPGGLLAISAHVTKEGYRPDLAARQWAEQCCAMFFTPEELSTAVAGLSLELISEDSAYDYERVHLPEDAWPPTEVYPEWALGQHMFALDREQCPIELLWLVWQKRAVPAGP